MPVALKLPVAVVVAPILLASATEISFFAPGCPVFQCFEITLRVIADAKSRLRLYVTAIFVRASLRKGW